MPRAWTSDTALAQYSDQAMTNSTLTGARSRYPITWRRNNSEELLSVLFAIIEHGRLAVLAPETVADVLGHIAFVDILPTFNAVSAASVRQPLTRLFSGFVGLVGEKDVAGCKIGGVQVEDVISGNFQPNTRKQVISAHSE